MDERTEATYDPEPLEPSFPPEYMPPVGQEVPSTPELRCWLFARPDYDAVSPLIIECAGTICIKLKGGGHVEIMPSATGYAELRALVRAALSGATPDPAELALHRFGDAAQAASISLARFHLPFGTTSARARPAPCGTFTAPRSPIVTKRRAAAVLLAVGIIILLVSAALLSGCYSPDLTRTRYTCQAENPICPGDLPCINGCCGGGECRGAVAMDAGTADQAGTVTDLAPLSGCAKGMPEQLTPRMFACRFTLKAGEYSDSSCAPGWHLCTQRDPQAVEPMQGFFLSGILAMQPSLPPVSPSLSTGWTKAGAMQNTSARYIYGFGVGNAAEVAYSQVGGFPKVSQCWPSNFTNCPWVNGDDRDAAGIVGNYGVVCCNF